VPTKPEWESNAEMISAISVVKVENRTMPEPTVARVSML
jgi:hypothetical protein